MKNTIIINNGSTSKKYAFYVGGISALFSHYEDTPNGFLVTEKIEEKEESRKIEPESFKLSFADFVNRLLSHGLIQSEDDVNSVAIRIVAPGRFFQEHRIVNDEYLFKLDEICNLSPLHLKPVKEEIANIKDRLSAVKLIAISDSAFHKDMPKVAKIYAIPKKLAEKNDIYRYGYHGISVDSVHNKFVERYGTVSKIIVCHLGGGASITAIKNGQGIETSMGFSPLEGMPMASRVGQIDPNALISIMDSEDFDTKELQNFLYKECGVKAISGISADTRVLLEESSNGNEDASLALDFYAYSVQKIIGSYYTVLGGLDALIFTGTIGERSAPMRQKICEKLELLGIKIDLSKNKILTNGDGLINQEGSVAKVAVLKTEEMNQMAKIAFAML